MTDYTWDDIIINPTSDRAKEAIGKEVYFSECPGTCLFCANSKDNEYSGVLDHIKANDISQFVMTNGTSWQCIIVKKKESYEERAKKWIRDNDLKVGDYVKVIRRAKDYEDGWDSCWTKGMDDFVGKVIPVLTIGEARGVLISLRCCEWIGCDFPYFVLEKVEEPKPEYVPFESPQEFISAYSKTCKEAMPDTESMLSGFGMWLKCGEHYESVTYIHNKGIAVDDVSKSWRTLFNSYTFLDGSPCGKLVEESNA